MTDTGCWGPGWGVAGLKSLVFCECVLMCKNQSPQNGIFSKLVSFPCFLMYFMLCQRRSRRIPGSAINPGRSSAESQWVAGEQKQSG